MSESDRLTVVLVASRNPLNIGAAARAMANFGFSRLRVVNPYEIAFREARSAVGASAVLASAQEYASVAGAVADCTLVVGTTAGDHRALHQLVRTPAEGGRLIHKRLASGPVALLFGSEKVGLSREDLSHCHWLVRIPTCEEHPSMNLGQSVAICLYELIRASSPAMRPAKIELATAGEEERITAMLLDLMYASGYLKSGASPLAAEKVRRLVRRLNLSDRDAELWLGIFRQIMWRLKTNQENGPKA